MNEWMNKRTIDWLIDNGLIDSGLIDCENRKWDGCIVAADDEQVSLWEWVVSHLALPMRSAYQQVTQSATVLLSSSASPLYRCNSSRPNTDTRTQVRNQPQVLVVCFLHLSCLLDFLGHAHAWKMRQSKAVTRHLFFLGGGGSFPSFPFLLFSPPRSGPSKPC